MEAVFQALAASGRLPPGTNLKAWLCRIMTNTFISSYRKTRTQPQPATGDAADAQLLSIHSPAGSAEDQMLGQLLDPGLITALTGIPPAASAHPCTAPAAPSAHHSAHTHPMCSFTDIICWRRPSLLAKTESRDSEEEKMSRGLRAGEHGIS